MNVQSTNSFLGKAVEIASQSLIILKTAVGKAQSAQSFEPESLALAGAFPTWE